jgi:hypothetical protein
VDVVDDVPLLVGHRLERLVAEDAGVVDQDLFEALADQSEAGPSRRF